MLRKSLLMVVLLLLNSFSGNSQRNPPRETTDVLIIGGGASGTMAAVQAARLGVKVLVIEETNWVGGMLTSAGVSAIDGNHKLPSGLWGEFRQKLYDHYGGPQAVQTGWVSNTLFEPAVGNRILYKMISEAGATVHFNTFVQDIVRVNEKWVVNVISGKKKKVFEAPLLIDCTELGDIAARVGVPYRIGMDSRTVTGETSASEKANSIIQDLTYVLVLKDYGTGVNKTISRPPGYSPDEFACACENDTTANGMPGPKCVQMMEYGRLPNNKFMINWPRCGNDFYLNLIELSPEERALQLLEAKKHSLRFLYYLQHELGFKSFGLAEDEFPTRDGLPIIPYHRESRRIKGLVELNVNHVASPFAHSLFRTGIAVGDYPIDHHHDKNEDAPKIDFINIKVPSYNVPLGALIPVKTDGIIVAEKSISVTNIVNGATRLQPVVMGIGQAAGALAAVCIKGNSQPAKVSVREVQRVLLDHSAWIMPYMDVPANHGAFKSIQRIGATGILKGTGIPYKWANQTWFYPDMGISEYELIQGLQWYYPGIKTAGSGALLSLGFLKTLFYKIKPGLNEATLSSTITSLCRNRACSDDIVLSRAEIAVLVDSVLDPFSMEISFLGELVNKSIKP